MSYSPPSKLSARVYKALSKLQYPVETEVSLGQRLRVDFVVRGLCLAIEADGDQHDHLTPFYHGDKIGFRDSKRRDNKKAAILEEQGLRLVRLSQDEILKSPSPEHLLEVILSKLAETQQTTDDW